MNNDPDFAAIVSDIEPEPSTTLIEYMTARADRNTQRMYELLRRLSHEEAIAIVVTTTNHLEQAFDYLYEETTAHARHHNDKPEAREVYWGRLLQSMAEQMDHIADNDHVGKMLRGESDDES